MGSCTNTYLVQNPLWASGHPNSYVHILPFKLQGWIKEQDRGITIISFSVFIVSRGGHRTHIKTSIMPITARMYLWRNDGRTEFIIRHMSSLRKDVKKDHRIKRVQVPGSFIYQQCRCACSKPNPKGLQCSGSAASSANTQHFIIVKTGGESKQGAHWADLTLPLPAEWSTLHSKC